MTDDEIAAFQEALLDALAESTDVRDVVDRVRARVGPSPLVDWLVDAEPRMVEVARDLSRRWALRG